MTTQPEPKIIFEDQHLVVLSKPAGLLSQGERKGTPSLVDWLREYFDRKYVGLIHRLDRNTSGLMVVAKRTKSARRLTESLMSDQIKRTYKVFLVGALKGDEKKKLRWHHWIVKRGIKNKVQIFKRKRARAKEARMGVQILAYPKWKDVRLTFVECKLETGRPHQIRVQSAFEGYPVLGDVKYGHLKYESLNKHFGRPALHSYSLSFPHPKTNEMMKFEEDLPDDMAAVLKR